MSADVRTPPMWKPTYPSIGYTLPWQPAHQKSSRRPNPAVAATQSAAHAAIATGFANSTASGFKMSVSSSSFHNGSTSVMYAMSKDPFSRHGKSVNTSSHDMTGFV